MEVLLRGVHTLPETATASKQEAELTHLRIGPLWAYTGRSPSFAMTLQRQPRIVLQSHFLKVCRNTYLLSLAFIQLDACNRFEPRSGF